MSGQGDCLLYTYPGDGSGKWTEIGTYLKGVDNNPYVISPKFVPPLMGKRT